MNTNIAGFKLRFAVGLTALALAAIPLNAAVALVAPAAPDTKPESAALSAVPEPTAEEKSCRDGLRFGITVDKIPSECRASLVGTLGQKEKWEYRRGYLFFDNGVLMAIRELKR